MAPSTLLWKNSNKDVAVAHERQVREIFHAGGDVYRGEVIDGVPDGLGLMHIYTRVWSILI